MPLGAKYETVFYVYYLSTVTVKWFNKLKSIINFRFTFQY